MIKLKGISDSMLRCVIPEEMPENELAPSLKAVRQKGETVLAEARVVLDFGARALSPKMICSMLEEFVWPSGIHVQAWLTYDAASQDLLKRSGLSTREPAPDPDERGENSRSLWVDRSLRSGQRVEHAGDVIVCGHINDGAEVLASGNVTVLGKLKGLVHAGVSGDEYATVLARAMEASQVRIASRFAALERDPTWWGKPVIVKVDEGAVLIDFWPAVTGA